MIYKDGTRVKDIKLEVKSSSLICRLYLDDGTVYSGKPEKIDPATMYAQTKLETMSVLVIAQTLKRLREEKEK